MQNTLWSVKYGDPGLVGQIAQLYKVMLQDAKLKSVQGVTQRIYGQLMKRCTLPPGPLPLAVLNRLIFQQQLNETRRIESYLRARSPRAPGTGAGRARTCRQHIWVPGRRVFRCPGRGRPGWVSRAQAHDGHQPQALDRHTGVLRTPARARSYPPGRRRAYTAGTAWHRRRRPPRRELSPSERCQLADMPAALCDNVAVAAPGRVTARRPHTLTAARRGSTSQLRTLRRRQPPRPSARATPIAQHGVAKQLGTSRNGAH